jgi:hypothetical protein
MKNDSYINGGTLIIGGLVVSITSRRGRQFIVDCLMFAKGQVSDDELRAKYNLSSTEWEIQKSIALEHSNQAAAQEERDRAEREAANKKPTNTQR